jgi:hypothetical protein
MTTEVLFYVALAIAGAGWAALIVFPRRPWSNFWFAGVIVPLILGIFYTLVMLLSWNANPPGRITGFFSLGGLFGLFQNPGLLLAAWIDLLVMPLIAGAWMTRRAAQVKIPYVYLVLCLIATLALPGTGVVLFVIVSSIGSRMNSMATFEGVPPVDCEPVAATARVTAVAS